MEREQRKLHAEINQTDFHVYPAKLGQRLDRVERLLRFLAPDKVA
jgi:hypothetical protein